jgi:hypothetical protein
MNELGNQELSIFYLGLENFNVISTHNPSNPLNLMPFTKMMFFLAEPDASFEVWCWDPKEIKDLMKDFSKMSHRQIDSILTTLHFLDTEKYHLLKRLLLGEESNDKIWRRWIINTCLSMPYSASVGELAIMINLSDSQESILQNHQSSQQMKLSSIDHDLLSRFYTVEYYTHHDKSYIFPIIKNKLKTLMYELSDEEFNQILDIFFSLDTTFYEAFKRIITNQETKNDHDIFNAKICTFRPDISVYVYRPPVYKPPL